MNTTNTTPAPWAEIGIVIDGSVDEEIGPILDQATVNDWLHNLVAEVTNESGFDSAEIYVLYHTCDFNDGLSCDCIQDETDHTPVWTSSEGWASESS